MRIATAIIAACGLLVGAPAAAQDSEVLVYTCISEGKYSYIVAYTPQDPAFVDVDQFKTSSYRDDSVNVGTAVGEVDVTDGLLVDTGEAAGLGNGNMASIIFKLAQSPTDPMSYGEAADDISFTHDLETGTLTENGNAAPVAIACDLNITDPSQAPTETLVIDEAGMSLGATLFELPDPNSTAVATLGADTGIHVIVDTGQEMDNFHWFAVEVNGIEGFHWGGYMCFPGMIRAGANTC